MAQGFQAPLCFEDDGQATAVEFRAEVARIAGSRQFRASPRLLAFLSYVMERTLAGQCSRIKGYTIAVEALGRDASFDPQSDPIVRVEAGRLRRALARYYAHEGRGASVMIALPRGSYVPVFQRRGASATLLGKGANLECVLDQLFELRRQLDAITADIESARASSKPAD
jgi:hypothetical protein